KELLLAAGDAEPAPPPRRVESLPRREAPQAVAPPALPPPAELPTLAPEEEQTILAEMLAEVAREAPAGQSPAAAYQDYETRCRMRGVRAPSDLARFRRDFAMARAGIAVDSGEDWEEAL